MADTITSTGTFNVTITNTTNRLTGDMSLTLTKTGSAVSSEYRIIPTGSWTALNTGSLTDLRYGYFANESTGTIQIAFTTSSIPFTTLEPNDDSKVSFSGSSSSPSGSLWAKAITAPSQLFYILTVR